MPLPSNVPMPFEIKIVEEERTNVQRCNKHKRSNVHTKDNVEPSYACATPSGNDMG